MKTSLILLLLTLLTFSADAGNETKEEAIQHLKVADVSSAIEAKRIVVEKTKELKTKNELNPQALHEIHYITYTLEKGIAYYAEHSTGEAKSQAKELAVVVEDIHINSENNRVEATSKHLTKYFELVAAFMPMI